MIIKAGSKLFLKERIVAIETKEDPRQSGFPEQFAAQILVDSGDRGYWFGLSDAEWDEFRSNLAESTRLANSVTTRNKWEHT